ncbi:MAG TPA: DUF4157 domain-containing protein, partial [Anaerolineae bacterium]|nr:DUF4157 domain-containing protein [Anaerolineae bacterium]
MSETTQNNKADTKTSSTKVKAEKEPCHLQTFVAIEGDLTGPAPEELFGGIAENAADATSKGILSHEPSALLQRQAAPAVRPLPVPAFTSKNFAHIPPRTGTQTSIQTKLTVGAAHDPYEEEADQVAEQVMRLPALSFDAPAGGDNPDDKGHPIQRALDEEEELQTKPLASTITPLVQRIPAKDDEDEAQPESQVQRVADEETELQTKRVTAADSFEMGDDFEGRVAATRGGGAPLPAEVRTFMEPRFGADFSSVRVHADSESAQLNRAVSAQAFTLGHDVYLGEGKTDLSSDSGKQLLAHELTHVVQQGSASPIISRQTQVPYVQREPDKEETSATATPDKPTVVTTNTGNGNGSEPPGSITPLTPTQAVTPGPSSESVSTNVVATQVGGQATTTATGNGNGPGTLHPVTTGTQGGDGSSAGPGLSSHVQTSTLAGPGNSPVADAGLGSDNQALAQFIAQAEAKKQGLAQTAAQQQQQILADAEAQKQSTQQAIEAEATRLEQIYTQTLQQVQQSAESARTEITTQRDNQIQATTTAAETELANLQQTVTQKQMAVQQAAESRATAATAAGEQEAQRAINSSNQKAGRARALGESKAAQYSNSERVGDIAAAARQLAAEAAQSILDSGNEIVGTVRQDASALAAKFSQEGKDAAGKFTEAL